MDSELARAKAQKEARASVLKRELETYKHKMEAEVALIRREAEAEVAVCRAEMETMASKLKVSQTEMYNSMRSVVNQAAETPGPLPQERDDNSYLVERLAMAEDSASQVLHRMHP